MCPTLGLPLGGLSLLLSPELLFACVVLLQTWVLLLPSPSQLLFVNLYQDLSRLIKESIHIRVNNPTLKRNIGKFNLSHIWDRVLSSTPDLKQPFPQHMHTYAHSNYRCCGYVWLSSDLKKFTVVD